MERKARYVAGGTAAVTAVGTSSLCGRFFDKTPTAFPVLFLTAELLAGSLLVLAYVGFRSDRKLLKRVAKSDGLADNDLAPACVNRIGFKGTMYRAGLFLFVLSGAFLPFSGWWAVIHPKK